MKRRMLNSVYHSEYLALNLSSKSHFAAFYALFLHIFFWLVAPVLCLALLGTVIGVALEMLIGAMNPIALILSFWTPLVIILPIALWKSARYFLQTYDLAFEQLLAVFGKETPKTETRIIKLRTILGQQKVTRSHKRTLD